MKEWKEVKETYAEKTWCYGCSNFGILAAAKRALNELSKENKIELKNVVTVVGIGCHAKIYDYLDLNGYYSLHGRVIPAMIGIKIANPELIPIGFAGDGDTFAEGMNHFVHACKRNFNINLFVHNNQVFGLTTGQITPTTEKGFKGPTTPFGSIEEPINPIKIALSAGATFIARGYAMNIEHLSFLIKEAILHKGFSFVDIIQPCITYHNSRSFVEKRIYDLQKAEHNTKSFEEAMKKANEWNYSLDENAKIPIGIFYKIEKPCFEDFFSQKPLWSMKRRFDKKILEEF
jgi:2-oxoglutarate ferredoxin oxidoreductase subunit beta